MQTIDHLQSVFEKMLVQAHREQAETDAFVEIMSKRMAMVASRCQEGLKRGLALRMLQFQEEQEGAHISAITLVALPFCIAYM